MELMNLKKNSFYNLINKYEKENKVWFFINKKSITSKNCDTFLELTDTIDCVSCLLQYLLTLNICLKM